MQHAREGRIGLLGRRDHRPGPRRPAARRAGSPSISYDITERKRTEAVVREQASLAQLGKMAAVVAHEVRNPIAGIRGALQILERRLPPAGPEQRVIRETLARLDALNDIVQDMLLFASPRPPRLEPVALDEHLRGHPATAQGRPALCAESKCGSTSAPRASKPIGNS